MRSLLGNLLFGLGTLVFLYGTARGVRFLYHMAPGVTILVAGGTMAAVGGALLMDE